MALREEENVPLPSSELKFTSGRTYLPSPPLEWKIANAEQEGDDFRASLEIRSCVVEARPDQTFPSPPLERKTSNATPEGDDFTASLEIHSAVVKAMQVQTLPEGHDAKASQEIRPPVVKTVPGQTCPSSPCGTEISNATPDGHDVRAIQGIHSAVVVATPEDEDLDENEESQGNVSFVAAATPEHDNHCDVKATPELGYNEETEGRGCAVVEDNLEDGDLNHDEKSPVADSCVSADDDDDFYDDVETAALVKAAEDEATDGGCESVGGGTGVDSKGDSDGFSFRGLSWRKKALFLFLGWSDLAAFMCMAILDPFFPIVAVAQDMSETTLGLFFSSFELWVFVSSPFFGNYIRSIGPKFACMAGQFLCGGCTILFGFLNMSPSGEPFIALCFTVRAVQALGASAYLTAAFAITAEQFSDHFSVVYGMLETFVGVGEIAGAMFGGGLYQAGGFGLPFFTIGALMLATSGLAFVLLPPSKDAVPQKSKGSSLRLLKSPIILFSCLAIMASCYTARFFDSSAAIHLQQFHLPEVVVGTFFGVYSVLYAVSCPLFGRFTEKKNFSIVFLIGGCTATCVGLLLMGPTPLLPVLKLELWLYVIGILFLGTATGAIMISSITCFYTGARRLGFEEGLRLDGLVSSLVNSSFYLGACLGPAIGNSVMQSYGYPWSSTLNAALCLFPAVGLSIYLLVDKKCVKRHDQDLNLVPHHCHADETTPLLGHSQI